MLCAACLAGLPSRGEEAVATIGKQRASASSVEWEVRDVDHPRLGRIKFASRKAAVVTPAGSETIVSQSYVSCQKSSRRIAVEFSNAFASNPAGGLGPRVWPRLTCYSPAPRGAGTLAMSELSPKWEVNDLGDALAQGLATAELRRCVSIDVLQDIALPAGSAEGSRQVLMELLTYGGRWMPCSRRAERRPPTPRPRRTRLPLLPRPTGGAPARSRKAGPTCGRRRASTPPWSSRCLPARP